MLMKQFTLDMSESIWMKCQALFSQKCMKNITHLLNLTLECQALSAITPLKCQSQLEQMTL